MLETKKSTTITGTVNVEVEGKKVPVAYLSASISEEGTPSLNKTIQNKELYLANKQEVTEDMREFEDMALAYIQ
jgi:hypothetical protein